MVGFLGKNRVSADRVAGSALIAKLVESGDTSLVVRDENDVYHFNGSFRNARDVQRALAALELGAYVELVREESEGNPRVV